MSFGSATAYAGFESSKDSIIDSNLPLLEKLRRLKNVNDESLRSDPSERKPLMNTIVGMALGLGVARGVGSLMGLNDDSQDKMNIAGAAFGGLMGLNKTAEVDRKNAFRLGFLKAAKAAGYFTKVAFNPLGLIVDPIVGAGQAARTAGGIAGSGLAVLDSYDDTDEDIMRMQVEKQMLKQHLAKVEAEHKRALIKRVLDKRRLET